MTPSILAGLCVWTEARGESQDGRAAVARVIKNRTVLRYESDGTLAGTVLAPNQFSGFWFDFVDAKYQRVCHTLTDAEARAEQLLKGALGDPSLKACQNVFDQVMADAYQGGDGYAQLTPRTVLYVNPVIVKRPAWADPTKRDATIGHTEFFHA